MGQALPDFDAPPVVEVVLSVQFDPLPGLRTPQIGLLWADYRKRGFVRTEEHPPLEPVIERFGGSGVQKPRFQVLSAPPVQRVWFLNAGGTELIQIQPDRFIHNWRKIGDAVPYPRYEHVRQVFLDGLRHLVDFAAREQLGELRPNQCEVTYVNQIEPGSVWQRHGQLSSVLTVFSPRYSDDFLSEPEDARVRLRSVIPAPDGTPCGRLHIAADPARRAADDRPVFRLNLTARGRPIGDGLNGVLAFLNLGREWVVRAFASVTTREMHAVWRRRDVP